MGTYDFKIKGTFNKDDRKISLVDISPIVDDFENTILMFSDDTEGEDIVSLVYVGPSWGENQLINVLMEFSKKEDCDLWIMECENREFTNSYEIVQGHLGHVIQENSVFTSSRIKE